MKKQKKWFLAEVVIRSKSDKVPDFGLGKGVLCKQEIGFRDNRGQGFKTPMFAAALVEYGERLVDETVEVRWTEKKAEKKAEK